MRHDYKRHGTIDLFAAMSLATGGVFHDTQHRHAGSDVLAFFKWIDIHVPRQLDVYVVLDNLSAHKSVRVRTWLADPNNERVSRLFGPFRQPVTVGTCHQSTKSVLNLYGVSPEALKIAATPA